MSNGHRFDFGEDFVERRIESGFSGQGHRLRRAIPEGRYAQRRLQDERISTLARPAAGATAVIRGLEGNVLAEARARGS